MNTASIYDRVMEKISVSSSNSRPRHKPNKSIEVELVQSVTRTHGKQNSAALSGGRRNEACSGCKCKIEKVPVDAVRKARERVANFRNKKPAFVPLRTLYNQAALKKSDRRSKSRTHSRKTRIRMPDELNGVKTTRHESLSTEKPT